MDSLNVEPNGEYVRVNYSGCFDGECLNASYKIPKGEFTTKQEEIKKGHSAIFDGLFDSIHVYQKNGSSRVIFKPSGNPIYFEGEAAKDIIQRLINPKGLEALA